MVSSSPTEHPEKIQHLRKKRNPASGNCKAPPPSIQFFFYEYVKLTKASEHARLLTSGYLFCLPKVQIRFFYLIFSGMCCLKMAALGKDGFINLFLAKPLSSSLMDTRAPLKTDPTSVCCVFFLMVFSLCMLLIHESPSPWAFFYPACLPFGCYSVLSAGQKLNRDGADACTQSGVVLYSQDSFFTSFLTIANIKNIY